MALTTIPRSLRQKLKMTLGTKRLATRHPGAKTNGCSRILFLLAGTLDTHRLLLRLRPDYGRSLGRIARANLRVSRDQFSTRGHRRRQRRDAGRADGSHDHQAD